MKLVTFTVPGSEEERLGVMVDDESVVLDVGAASERSLGRERRLGSMQTLIERGSEGLEAVAALRADGGDRDRFPLRDVRLLAPLPRPVQMRDCLSFRAHLTQAMERRNKIQGLEKPSAAQDARMELYDRRPQWYKCNRMAVCGPETTIAWPSYSRLMDYEHELGIVIGRKGVNISETEAGEYIFGYTIFNDLSARDVQEDEMNSLGPNKSKDFDNSNVLGPCIVTADSFDLADARMISRINGEVQNDNNTSTITWSVAQVIAAISRHETIYPGEIICTGTVGGGCGVETGRLLTSGDVVELEVEGIGVLRNRIVASDTYEALG